MADINAGDIVYTVKAVGEDKVRQTLENLQKVADQTGESFAALARKVGFSKQQIDNFGGGGGGVTGAGVPGGSGGTMGGGLVGRSNAAAAGRFAKTFTMGEGLVGVSEQHGKALRDISKSAGAAANSWSRYAIGMAYAARHILTGGPGGMVGGGIGLGVGGALAGPYGAYIGSIAGSTVGAMAQNVGGSALSAAGTRSPAHAARFETAKRDLEASYGEAFVGVLEGVTRDTRKLADITLATTRHLRQPLGQAYEGAKRGAFPALSAGFDALAAMTAGASVGAAPNPNLGQNIGGPDDLYGYATQKTMSQSPPDWFKSSQPGSTGMSLTAATAGYGVNAGMAMWLWGLAQPSMPGPAH